MCMIGDEYVELLQSKDRRARKQHRCAECGRTIEVSETYRYETWVWEGTIGSQATCAHCLGFARSWLIENCQGWIYGAMYEDIAEHFPDGAESSPMTIGRILVGMRRGWRRGDGTLMPLAAAEAEDR